MDLNENYLLRKKSEYVVHLLKKFRFQIEAPTQLSLLDELETEMCLKPVCKKMKVGF